MKQYLLTLFCLCVSMIALAQQKTITGTVIDANNEPVIGASVLEKGTSNGTITNLDGEYSLSVSAGATLVFSYIGYKTQEVSIGNKTTIKITLVEDSRAIGRSSSRWLWCTEKIKYDCVSSFCFSERN